MKKSLLAMTLLAFTLTGCQPKQTPQDNPGQTENTAAKDTAIPAIQAKTIKLALKKSQVCEAAETEDDWATCTKYHLQSIDSNVAWLNDYFKQLLEKDHAEAFDDAPAIKVELDPDMPSTNYSSASVRYIGQHDHLATFEYVKDYYPAGAAHGMHHSEYITFDLSTKQRLQLNDILKPAVKEQLLEELYDNNSEWLEAHNVKQADLTLSENFYFGVNGIVFVYPLYELASYAEGLSELELPYWSAQKFIKPEYLPQLPDSSDEMYEDE